MENRHDLLINKYPTNNDEGIINHNVLWSGGCDSTLLLYELIKKYGYECVTAYSFEYPWLQEEKVQSERSHRELFKAKLGTENKKVKHVEIKIGVSSGEEHLNICGHGLPQAVGWLGAIMPYLDESSAFYAAYIKSDDLINSKHEYIQMFNYFSKMAQYDTQSPSSRQLRMPYEMFNKKDILRKLIEYNIYNTTWFCEMPISVNKICGQCVPCEHHIEALNALQISNKESEFVRCIAKNAYSKITSSIERCEESEKDNIISET